MGQVEGGGKIPCWTKSDEGVFFWDSLPVVAVKRFQQGRDCNLRGDEADIFEIRWHCCHRLMGAPGAVIQLLVRFGVHGPLSCELAAQTEQTAEPRRRAQPDDFPDRATVEHAGQNGRPLRAPCEMANDASGRNPIGGAEDQIHALDEGAQVVGLGYDIAGVRNYRLLGPTPGEVVLECCHLEPADTLGPQGVPKHVVPEE